MKRIVWTFGLISGAILSVAMMVTVPFIDKIGDLGEVLGYSTMVLAFLMVYFGIRSYRDNMGNGSISFGKACRVGILITLISSACYVATWEVIYYKFVPDFGEKYARKQVEKARASGASQEEIDAQAKKMAEFAEMYKNPFINIGMTFAEAFPVGLVITLLCAGILKRKPSLPGAGATVSGAMQT